MNQIITIDKIEYEKLKEELNYYKQLADGNEYQDFVAEKLYEMGIAVISYASKKYQYTVGENRCGFEIKHDKKLAETGNLYIEIAEKNKASNKSFIPSGIYRNDNTLLYIIGDYNKIFIFDKKRLRTIYEGKYYEKINGRYVEIGTSQGFLIPADYAEENIAIKVIHTKVGDNHV